MNKSGIRRLKHEIKYLQENLYTVKNDTLDTFHVNVENIGKITLIVSENYPFKKPIILINNKSYLSFLEKFGRKYEKIYKIINNNSCCFLCDSYECNNNWSVFTKIINIIDEIKNKYTIINLCIYYSLLIKIKKKYNIPEEILIFSYLHYTK